MCSELRNFARFRDPTDSSPHFGDVWTDAQRSRSAFIQWFVSAVWQRFSDTKTTIKTDITPDGRDLEATHDCNFLHAPFATNQDSFVIFMFIVVGMVLSICLTLGLGPAPPMG